MLVSLCQFVKYEGVLYPENLSILKSNYQFLSSHRTDLRTLIEMTRDETLMGIFLQ